MKTTIIIVLAVAGMLLSSCSKCYECRIEVQVQTPDTTYTSYQSQELCTASKNEVEEKESQGYQCN